MVAEMDVAFLIRDRRCAEAGHAASQHRLGELYSAKSDYKQAVRWFTLAAEAGFASAQRAAASPRTRAAAEFFEKAAAQGDTDGMVNLGAACLVGRGVPQDEARARELPVVEEAAAPVVEEAVVEEAAAPVVEEPAVDVPTAPSRDVDGPLSTAPPLDRESDAEAVAAPAPAVDEPAWRRRWGAGLKAGDGVDARDSEGRWFDSVVVDVDGSRVKVHFRGWSTRWDSWFDRDDEGFWANVEPRFALTEDWRRQLRVGDGVETRSEDKPLWYAARVVETSGTSWVAVKTESPGSPSWIETSSERLCQPGTHIKRHRKASSLATKISALKADAVNGDTTAMMKLGRMFLSGDDVPEDPSSAVKLFEDAAARGSVHAMLYLGAAHLVGAGVSCGVDVDRAREFVRRVAAANGGDVRGARRLVALRAIEVDRSQRELIRRTAPADATGDARRALAAPWLASYLARLEDEDEDAPPEAPRAPPAEAAPASKPSAAAPPPRRRVLELDAEATTALAQLPEREAAGVLRELARKGEDVRNPSASTRAVRAAEDGGPREAEAEAPRDDGFGDATVAEILERLDLRRLLPLFRSHEIDDDSLFHLERADFAEIGVPAPDVPRICAAVAARRKAKTVSVQGEIDGAARHQAQLEAALADHRAEVARLRVGRRAVPEELCCPVTCELMKDPVMADDGHTYERVAIEQWFATGKRTSPKTNESLPSTVVRPNHAVKSMIAGFLDACRRSGVAPDD
ncbi:ubiquitin-protein transferase [Aureococcus anophagefferens]|nr:ubiquitin-protein transferase [Aureococcus anophagefferens]